MDSHFIDFWRDKDGLGRSRQGRYMPCKAWMMQVMQEGARPYTCDWAEHVTHRNG